MSRVVLRRSQRTSVRRPQPALTAAATQIGVSTDPAKGFSSTLPKPALWSEKAWEFLTRIGELSYYVNWKANAVSRVDLVAAGRDPMTGKPVPIEDDDRVGQLVAKIVRDIGGDNLAMILKRLAIFLSVPGDGYIAMLVRDNVEKWYALSRDELTAGGQKIVITLPDQKKHEFDPEADLIFRVWEPDPRKAWEPTSPIRANLDVLQEIVRATQSIDNANASRLIGKGILLVPDEINLPSSPAPRAERESNPAPEPTWDNSSAQDLQDLLFEVGTTAYKDQNSMAAMFPIIATVPGEYADKVKLLDFGTDISETALKTREAAIRRLALGLDVSPERLLGLSTGNHWSAWAIGEDDIRLHIVPTVETIADAFTEYALKPALEALGIDPSAYVVHYDASGLTQDPDRKSEALAANAAGALSNEALLRYLGFNPEDGYDLDTLDGWQQLARDKASRDISLLPQLAVLAAPAGVEIDVEPMPAALPPADTPVPTSSAPAPPSDSEPVEQASAAAMLVELSTRRALEFAGKRMTTRGNHYSVPHGTPAHLIYRHLIKPAPGDVMRLIDGWEAIVSDDMLRSVGITRASLRRVVQARAVAALLDRA